MEILVGVLVDVSGSMKSSLKLHVGSNDENITRAQSIFTTIMNIVEREAKFQQNHDVFVLAFGLEDIPTCDLLSLLDYVQEDMLEFRNLGDGHDNLIELLKKNGAPYTDQYIRKYMPKGAANFLFRFYSREENRWLLRDAVKKLPRVCKVNDILAKGAKSTLWFVDSFESMFKNEASREEIMVAEQIRTALSLAKAPILEKLKQMQNPRSKTFQSTVCLLNAVAGRSMDRPTDDTRNQNHLSSAQLSDLVGSIEPFIYGGTPMRRAIELSLVTFNSCSHEQKFLFLLSDGQSSDGSPTRFVEDLLKQKVIVFACLLTSENLLHPRQLYYDADPNWTRAQLDMFELSSIVENSHPAMSILMDRGWKLPEDGESRLFIQANHPDVIKEFSNTIQYMSEGNHVLLSMIQRVSLDKYINKEIARFKPRKQYDPTCYAYAVGTVFHLAMCRIIGREGGTPKFEEIYERLVKVYENKEARTSKVLAEFAPQYRLRYRVVNELGARQAINNRRPVVATFRLHGNQWDAFDKFYEDHPRDVLEKHHLGLPDSNTDLIGHAVVLMKCNPKILTFLNSGGISFADGGFFRVRDQQTLGLTFFDVYWDLRDLKESEIQAFQAVSVAKGRDLIGKLPTDLQNIPYECPHCHKSPEVHTFIIHFLDSECPECHQRFKPTLLGLNVSAYVR